MELYYIDIKEKLSNSDYAKCISLIDNKKREKINRYHFLEDRKRSLYADVLIRYLATIKLGLKNDDLCFSTNSYGKPYLVGNYNLNYNISHSGRYILCGIGSEELGVDIEKIVPIDIRIAKKFFSKVEYERIMAVDKLDATNLFYQYWTLKESYIKYKGMGLSLSLDSFSFINSDKGYELIDNREQLHFVSRIFEDDYYLAVTYKTEVFNDKINYVKVSAILNTMVGT